jgi:ABC-2 type transport system ATP-binding protein
MIEADKLTKDYGTRLAVKDVTFHIEQGEIVGLLGPNGAGKTTTMRMLTGYLPATSGTAKVAGFDVRDQPMQVRRHLGYLPETVPLYTDMTVKAYLDFTAKIRGVNGRDRRRRVQEVMELCQIADVANRVIAKISRGYKQRVGLAQAIIHNPDVIILDEPTVGLDPRQIVEIRRVIRDLAGSHSMILSTHILQEVSTLCDRVIIINQGRVLIDDTLGNLQRAGQETERLQFEVRAPYNEAEEFFNGFEGIVAVDTLTKWGEADPPPPVIRYVVESESGLDLREQLAHAIIAKEWGLLELKTAVPNLEEIFVKVITEDNEAIALLEAEAIAEAEEELDEPDDDLDDDEALDEPQSTKPAPKFLRQDKDDDLDDPTDPDEELDEPAEVEEEPKPKKKVSN